MRRAVRISATTLLLASSTLSAQSNPVVREVAPPTATSAQRFKNIFTIRETSNGRVILNDGLARQLILLDNNLSTAKVVVDSVVDGGQSYGSFASPLLRWLGDSSIMLDQASRSLVVLDGEGKVVRTMAPPKQTDIGRLANETTGHDLNGNLFYRAYQQTIADTATAHDGTFTRRSHPGDSMGVVRASFQTRKVDTIARTRMDGKTSALQTTKPNGAKFLHVTLSPITQLDDWAVLSDGTVAIVRGHDYHIDWLLPDGSKKSSEKLPFDWKRLTDVDKQHLVDSIKTVIEKTRADAEATGGSVAGNDAVVNFLRNAATPTTRPAAPPPANLPKVVEPTVTYDFTALKDIPDYYPAIRTGAARADEDGNLWILPTTSAQSKRGELVYDVVNAKGAPFYRVRMPVGRSIAGFGKNGVVYLMHRDGASWALERTRVTTTVSAKD